MFNPEDNVQASYNSFGLNELRERVQKLEEENEVIKKLLAVHDKELETHAELSKSQLKLIEIILKG